MKRDITYSDIARLAKVSKATVSKVLNNKPGISQATRQRVLKSCQKLGYTPNLIARSLRLKKTHSIGLVIPDLMNQFFSEFSKGVQLHAQERGYTVLLGDSFEDEEKEKLLVETFISRQVDALIVISTVPKPEYINRVSVPLVFADRFVEGAKYFVSSDSFTGGFIGTDYLIKTGRKNIMIISGPQRFYTNKQRVSGCKEALLKHTDKGINFRFLEVENVSVDTGIELGKKILEEGNIPDAIFALSDLLAVGMLKALRKNFSIPDQLSILGFDNIRECEYVSPEISSVHQEKFQMGVEAAKMVIDCVETGDLTPRTEIFPVRLIVRAST